MTPFIKKKDIKQNWYIINAENAAVGRLAAFISKVLRGKKTSVIKMMGISACSYNVQTLPSGSPNAFADGEKVFITMAAIKLAETKDELAFLIGHELAHNIFHYKQLQ